MKRPLLVQLTMGERNALYEAASYYLNDADPTREGDLAGVHPQTWKALERALDKLAKGRVLG